MDLVDTEDSEVLSQRELIFIECFACTKYFNKMQSSCNSNLLSVGNILTCFILLEFCKMENSCLKTGKIGSVQLPSWKKIR